MCRVLVLAAGQSQRFKDIGITTPKGLIRFGYLKDSSYTRVFPSRIEFKTMIEHVVTGIPEDWPIYVAVQKEEAELFAKELPSRFRVIEIEETQGQAETLVKAFSEMPLGPVLVLNSDVGYNYPLEVFARTTSPLINGGVYSAAALVSYRKRDRYSYVSNFPVFSSAKEKVAISSWAMLGAYMFSNSYGPNTNELVLALEQQKKQKYKELFISEMMLFIPGSKLAVYSPLDEEEHAQGLEWGTPEALRNNPDILLAR